MTTPATVGPIRSNPPLLDNRRPSRTSPVVALAGLNLFGAGWLLTHPGALHVLERRLSGTARSGREGAG